MEIKKIFFSFINHITLILRTPIFIIFSLHPFDYLIELRSQFSMLSFCNRNPLASRNRPNPAPSYVYYDLCRVLRYPRNVDRMSSSTQLLNDRVLG